MAMYRNGDKVIDLIRKRETFVIGNVSGDWYSNEHRPQWGRLESSSPIRQEMLKLLMETDLYVVHSYLTPIAYTHTKEIIVPEVTYSPTTSNHQHLARMADRFGTLPGTFISK